MFLNQFGDDVVLASEFVAKGVDRSVEATLGRGVLSLEGRRAVLEEQLLPLVEQGG